MKRVQGGRILYLLILVIACIFDFILEKIKDFKLYYYGLDLIPYTRYELVKIGRAHV